MIRSPRSASAISNARNRLGGMTSTSTGRLGVDVHQHGLALQLRQLARERAGAMGDDQLAAAGFVALGDVDLAGQDDHQAGADLADRDQRLARAVAADLAEPPHAFDLRRLQRGNI